VESEKFPQEPFNPIPSYSFSQSFGRYHSQARPTKIIFGQRDNKMRRVPISAAVFHPLEFSPGQQSVGFGEIWPGPDNVFYLQMK
jgi:hypothetical protein